MRRLLTATAALSLAAAPAFAGALIFEPAQPEPIAAPAPVVAPVALPTWTGPYVGGELGWSWLDADGTVAAGDFDVSDNGLIGGVFAGYDWQLQNGVVLGGEVAYNLADLTASGENASVSLDNVVRLTGRAGFGFGEGLLYARGGAAWLDGDVTTVEGTSSSSDWGWVAGAGYEQRITQNVSAGIEALYHDVSGLGAADANLTTVQARLSWRF